MTETADPVRAFAAALPPWARGLLSMQDAAPDITAAVAAGRSPGELAVLVSVGTFGLENPAAVMKFRLRRYAGHDGQDTP
jgi:hypothetical protein